MNASHAITCRSSKCEKKNGARCGIGFGLTLVAAGVLFLMQYLGYLAPYTALQFWPGIFVICGLGGLFSRQRAGGKIFGFLMFAGGSLGLAHTLGFVAIPWSMVWPSAIVLAGLGVLVGVVFFRKRPKPVSALEVGGSINARVVMGSQEERHDGTDFDGGNVQVTMGSYHLDLTDAVMKGKEATLAVQAAMGEVKVKVPATWRTRVDGARSLASVEDKTNHRFDGDGEAPLLIIAANISLGELAIRN